MIKRLRNKFLLILFTGILSGNVVMADEVSVKATLDSVTMLIGHQTKLTLEMTKPSNADIAFPMILDTLVDKVEVLERGVIDTTFVNDSRQHLVQELLITSFDSGFYYIPPFEFEIMPNSGGGAIESNPLVLKMYTYQIDTIAGVFDIKPVKKIKYTFREFAPYIFAWFILLAAVLGGLALYRRFKKQEPLFAAPPKPKEPPYITAFRELERIRSEKLWQKEKEKEYFTELTDTLRTYIEGRYNVLAMEQTSDEILDEIKDVISKEHYKKLESTLKLADLVKFAKMRPMMDESERCIKEAYSFVDETKFVPESSDLPEDGESVTQKVSEENLENKEISNEKE